MHKALLKLMQVLNQLASALDLKQSEGLSDILSTLKLLAFKWALQLNCRIYLLSNLKGSGGELLVVITFYLE